MTQEKNFLDQALNSNAWPFQEAKKILEQRLGEKVPSKGYVLFETGYGPSGLPHIGTFGEAVRTTMVMQAFKKISGGMPTKLFCVSDDMDGMRKVPDTIPNKKEYEKYFDLPLTEIPDPFGKEESYGHYMNKKLKSFLDKYGFEYEFKSATEYYKSGIFNEYLIRALHKYDEIMAVMLPTLGPERRATYSPFMPVCAKTGKVLQVPVIARDTAKNTIKYKDLYGEIVETEVTDGKCKLQWKPDFGMRWAAFDVDFEMYGKDHLANGPIYTKICKILGGKSPHQMFYELFLDEKGQKISKSKGNGITIEEWLKYAPKESLALYMYQSPKKAKKLYFDVIPKSVDEYLAHQIKFHQETDVEKHLINPLYHIHNGEIPKPESRLITYSLVLNLVSACNTENEQVIFGYLKNFDNSLNDEAALFTKGLVKFAINYYKDFIKPYKKYKNPTDKERAALSELALFLKSGNDLDATTIQNKVYEIGKNHEFELKEWFCAIYEILLGSSKGPRVGTFIKLYGTEKTIELINRMI